MNKTLAFSKSLKKFYVAIGAIALLVCSIVTHVKAQLDPTFGTNGMTFFGDAVSRIPIGTFPLPGGKLAVLARQGSGGSNDRGPFDLIRLNADGSPDTSFGTGGIFQLSVPFISQFGIVNISASAMQPDGKFVLAGSDNGDGLILRFNADGSPDTGFGTGGLHRANVVANATDMIGAVLVQSDGKILAGGDVNNPTPGGPEPTFLIRYNSDGTLDTSFGSQGYAIQGIEEYVTKLAMQSTGKYIALVGFGKIKRFNSDGSLDTGFVNNNQGDGGMTLLPNDKILFHGRSERPESVQRVFVDPKLTRYNADGSLDTGFGIGGSLTFYWSRYISGLLVGVTPLSDGRVLLSGFVEVPGNRTVRYRGANGAVAILSASGEITHRYILGGFPIIGSANIVVLPDGKFVFGAYTEVSSSRYRMHFARITGVLNESYFFKGSPFDFFTGDGKADPTVYRPNTGQWFGAGGWPFGTTTDIFVPADYVDSAPFQKDLAYDLAYFRPSEGKWYISSSFTADPARTTVTHWGQNGDIPAPADYDGDTKADLTVFRPSSGDWYIRNSIDNSMTAIHWGATGDKPVPGDYDGDGRDDIAVFRPSVGDWYVFLSGGGYIFLHFGMNGDIPVQDDYDGDGKTDISVWRPSDGGWYRLNSSDGSFYGLYWGLPTDIPVPADYDGDGKTDISVFRPSDRVWYIFSSITNDMKVLQWGAAGDMPVARRQ